MQTFPDLIQLWIIIEVKNQFLWLIARYINHPRIFKAVGEKINKLERKFIKYIQRIVVCPR